MSDLTLIQWATLNFLSLPAWYFFNIYDMSCSEFFSSGTMFRLILNIGAHTRHSTLQYPGFSARSASWELMVEDSEREANKPFGPELSDFSTEGLRLRGNKE